MEHTSEKLAAVATAGFILLMVVDMVFGTGMFKGASSLTSYGVLMVLVGNFFVMLRHLTNKDSD